MGCLDQILERDGQKPMADVVLAPMAGITDRAFRTAVRQSGGGLVTGVSPDVFGHLHLHLMIELPAKM